MSGRYPQLSAYRQIKTASDLFHFTFAEWQGRIKRAPLGKLGALRGALALAANLTQGEAEQLDARIEARLRPKPAKRRVGSRPRTPESLLRRRRLVAEGWLPPAVACRYTPSEQAVLAIEAQEYVKKGYCDLAVGATAALAGVSESTVRNARRQAVRFGHVNCQERPVAAFRNDTNVIRVVDPGWLSWLRLGARRLKKLLWAKRGGGGCKFVNPTHFRKDRSSLFGCDYRGKLKLGAVSSAERSQEAASAYRPTT
jgi:hypothetical protein